MTENKLSINSATDHFRFNPLQEAANKYDRFMQTYTTCVIAAAVIATTLVQAPRWAHFLAHAYGMQVPHFSPEMQFLSNSGKGFFQAIYMAAGADLLAGGIQAQNQQNKIQKIDKPMTMSVKDRICKRFPVVMSALGMAGGVGWELFSTLGSKHHSYDWDDTATMAAGFSVYAAATKRVERFAYKRFIEPVVREEKTDQITFMPRKKEASRQTKPSPALS
jgi:hypothetical protein